MAGRDKLIDAVMHGRMSPAQAEAEAARLGLEPLAPAPDAWKYHPLSEVWWTLPVTVAWIAWRTARDVQEF